MRRRALVVLTLLSLMSMPAACHGTLQVGVETAPTPSPGLALGRLAYVKGDDIWIRELPDGEPRRLTTDGRSNGRPRWSPSGRWLSYLHLAAETWVMRADGSDAHRIEAAGSDGQAAWSPVEDRLAYITLQGSLMVIEPGEEARAFRFPASEGDVAERIMHLAWSPDGRWLACEVSQWTSWAERDSQMPPTRQVLRLLRADGQESRELWAETRPLETKLRLAGWSGDGSRILFWRGHASESIAADGLTLVSVPAGGGELQILDEAVLPYPDFVARQPLSPQLALVVGSGRDPWLSRELRLVEAGGKSSRQMSPDGQAVSSPAWSQDGRRLAYVAMPARERVANDEEGIRALGERHIWLINADGTGAQQLTNDPAYRDEWPLWSADGSHILFARVRDWRASLWLVQSDGGGLAQVADDLTPAPVLFAHYGHVDWQFVLDWWRGPARAREPQGNVSSLRRVSIARGASRQASYGGTVHGGTRSHQALPKWGPGRLSLAGGKVWRPGLSHGLPDAARSGLGRGSDAGNVPGRLERAQRL